VVYVGLDIHSKRIALCVLSETGQVAHRSQVLSIEERRGNRERSCSVENPRRAGTVSLILALSATGCTTARACTLLAGMGRNRQG
jgi:hypothetical protein